MPGIPEHCTMLYSVATTSTYSPAEAMVKQSYRKHSREDFYESMKVTWTTSRQSRSRLTDKPYTLDRLTIPLCFGTATTARFLSGCPFQAATALRLVQMAIP